MKAVQLVKFGEPAEALKFVDLPDPVPGPGDVVVKIEAAGVCGRDLVVRKGAFPHVKPPIVPGHEGVGKIVDVGPGVEKDIIGERVFLSGIYDGTCEYCKRGLENLCKNAELLGESRNGTYAEYVLVPAKFAHPFHGLDPRVAVVATCPLSTAVYALRHVDVEGKKVLVVGAGGTGIYIAQLTKVRGAEVYVSTRSPDKARVLKELGINTAPEGEKDFDVVVDTVGSPTLERSLKLAKRSGSVLVIGNVTGEKALLSPALIILRQLKVIGSMAFRPWDIYEALDILKRGLVKPLYTEYKLQDAARAHEDMERGAVIGRAILVP
ncbi:alcohol dehydrogenase catalytic domain-containing protein [Pyrobaculum sp.]|uniref:alcohol dehydrogenase catalytic domain-containing protein n=1 Tax=Pyrobaculum sp. TaxID=2004705 RepID=UPI00316A8D22